ncbi:MAG: type II toxin-antitoxin system VapC family toxin [Candidatus Eremiobacteraeota bacterium]|nr:type II toxin-antitoxin system VapC family toxin [Candidatus Eremiobacteraeota bacterium]
MSGRVLLDTHVFLSLLAEPKRIPASMRRSIEGADERLLSVASLWEMAIKSSIGKLRLPMPVGEFVRSRMKALDGRIIAISARHAAAVEALPLHHRDPFDRLIVVQAMLEDARLMTLDTELEAYRRAAPSGQGKKRR